MRHPACCPRCGDAVRPPDRHSASWRCFEHGVVAPVHLLAPVDHAAIDDLRSQTGVPLWMPTPAPPAWSLTGLGWAGPQESPAVATVVACSGPAPLGGDGELILVAEEPGTGLGAGYAALPGPDVGPLLSGPPSASVRAAGHVAPLWEVPSRDDRCIYVGEALGVWLWAVLWPATASLLLVEGLVLADAREHVPVLVAGDASPHLRPHR